MTAHPNDMTRSRAAGATAAGAVNPQVAEAAPAPEVRVLKAAGGVLSLDIDHDDQAAGWALFRASLGGHSRQLTDMLVMQLAELSRQDGAIAEPALNYNLGIIQGIAPRDTAELLLAMQMAAVHGATMATARRLNGDQTSPRQDNLFNALNKLARTFAMQVETLKRYRNGAQRPDPDPAGPDDGGQLTIIRAIIREPQLAGRERGSEAKLGEAALGEASTRGTVTPKGAVGARPEAEALSHTAFTHARHLTAPSVPSPLRDFAGGRPQDDRSLRWSDLSQEGHESYARMARPAGEGGGRVASAAPVARPPP